MKPVPSSAGGKAEAGESSPATPSRRFRRDSVLILLSIVAVGAGNYGFGLTLVWVLPPRPFAITASISTLILVAATTANSALPWVLAREVSRHGPGSRIRREAVGFVLAIAVAGGAIAAVVVVALAIPYASAGVDVAAAVAVMAIFVLQVSSGHLQGSGRFATLALLGMVEVTVKVGAGTGLAAAGGGATGAVTGTALGAAIWAVYGFAVLGRDIAVPGRAVRRELWGVTRGISAIQVGVVALTSLDVVVGSIRQHGSSEFAGYLAMLVFARIPFFVSGAVSAVAYPRLTAAGGHEAAVAKEMVTFYLSLGAAVGAVAATIPDRLLGILLPNAYASDIHLLVPLALAGIAAGQINLLTTLFQAEGRFTPVVRLLWAVLPVAAIIYAFAGGSTGVLAWASAATDGTVALVLTGIAPRHYPRAAIAGRTTGALIAALAFGGLLYLTRSMLPLWLSLAALGGVGMQAVALRIRPDAAERRPER